VKTVSKIEPKIFFWELIVFGNFLKVEIIYLFGNIRNIFYWWIFKLICINFSKRKFLKPVQMKYFLKRKEVIHLKKKRKQKESPNQKSSSWILKT
jgi:glycosyltransferase involved in cell wall biosynthesis